MQLLNQPFGQLVGKRQNAALPLSISNEGCAKPSAPHSGSWVCSVRRNTDKQIPKPKEQTGNLGLDSNQRTNGARDGTRAIRTTSNISAPKNSTLRVPC